MREERESSFKNSRSPWRELESINFMATERALSRSLFLLEAGRRPRKTGPKPPWPSLLEGEKEEVARRSRVEGRRWREVGILELGLGFEGVERRWRLQ